MCVVMEMSHVRHSERKSVISDCLVLCCMDLVIFDRAGMNSNAVIAVTNLAFCLELYTWFPCV